MLSLKRIDLVLVTISALWPLFLSAQSSPQASAHWHFARKDGSTPTSLEGVKAKLEGQYAYVPGPRGDAVRFDGYTSSLVLPASSLPDLGEGFTVEATVALNTYPWNHLPLLDDEKAHEAGVSFEVDAFGHLLLGASFNGEWQTLRSTEALPLKQWAHVAATYGKGPHGGELSLYLNGQRVAQTAVAGTFSPAKTDALVGRVREPELPFPEAEIRPAAPFLFSLDGLLSELTIAAKSLDATEIAKEAAPAALPQTPALPFTPMPSGTPAPGRFGAYYTGLPYEESWDALRRVDNNSDVVVRFEDSPTRLVFWQGLNYIPAWVSGDDKWYTDEFLEVWDAGCPDGGDCEPMSDKQERFNRVNIVESNDVRAVVHWRYALAEVVGAKGAWQNPRTGWSDWADEYWTVYPDGIAIRKQVLHSDHPDAVHEWQETIVLHQPGKTPEDDIADDAVTLGNMNGEVKTFHWTPKADTSFRDPQGPSGMAPLNEPSLQIVNTKSRFKPFQIVPPKGATADFYNNEKSFFTFECWNHWPVAQIPSSDRPCVTSDRPSHSSLSHLFWPPYAETADSATKILMDGLTTATMTELLPLARSWTSPPVMTASAGDVTAQYDPTQRAFVVQGNFAHQTGALLLTLHASAASPTYNPALLLKNWGEAGVQVSLGGHILAPGRSLRMAHVSHLEGTDLLLWLPLRSEGEVRLSVQREK